jgi:hypothetical protein
MTSSSNQTCERHLSHAKVSDLGQRYWFSLITIAAGEAQAYIVQVLKLLIMYFSEVY